MGFRSNHIKEKLYIFEIDLGPPNGVLSFRNFEELAHYHMGHDEDRKGSQEKEIEADQLVKSWGFDIKKFRKEFPINGKEA